MLARTSQLTQLLLLLILVGASLLPASGQAALTQSDIEDLTSQAAAYLDAVQKKDSARLRQFWVSGTPALADEIKRLETIFASAAEIASAESSFGQPEAAGNRVSIKLVTDLSYIDAASKESKKLFDSKNRVLWLTKKDDGWKFLRHISLELDIAEKLVPLDSDAERMAVVEAQKELEISRLINELVSQGNQLRFREPFPDRSYKLLHFALNLAEKTGEKTTLRFILANLGGISEQRGDPATALEMYERVLPLENVVSDPEYRNRIIAALSAVNLNLGNRERAMQLYKESLAFAERTGSERNIIPMMVNLASAYRGRGDFYNALSINGWILETVERLGKNEPGIIRSPMAISALNNTGRVYGYLGLNDKAVEYYNQAKRLDEETGRPNGIVLINLGAAMWRMGLYEKSREFYEKAYQLHADAKARNGMAIGLYGIGRAYWAEHNYSKAVETFERRLAFVEVDGQVHYAARNDLAFNLVKKGEPQKALEIVQASLKELPDDEISSARINADMIGGMAHEALNEKDNAEKFLRRAVSGSDKFFAMLEELGVGPEGLEEVPTGPYRELAGLLIDQDKPADAFALSESLKARALHRILLNGRYDVYSRMTAEERKTEAKLRLEMTLLNGQLSGESGRQEPNSDKVARLTGDLEKARQLHRTFQSKMFETYPAIRVGSGELQPLALNEVGGLLAGANSAAVEFLVTDDRTIALVALAGSSGESKLLVGRSDVKSHVLTAKLSDFHDKVANGDPGFQAASRELYDLLLKPIEKELSGKTNIIIVPDGPLWDLPFQALMDEKGKYLIEKAAVSYAPSLTALKEMRKRAGSRKPSPDGELLAFGNPIVGTRTKARVQRVFMSEKLDPIPEAEHLVNELGKMYGPKRSKVFTGANAREETAKTESPKYKIVQFATHGILNNASPMYSHLVMAQNDKNSNEDGLLEAWELKDLDLKADMVILTACETARGKISNGEGVIGMTWASFIAGAPTTVASQWKVEPASTSELMLEFHRQLLSKERVSKAEALRRASLRVMKMPRYRHPLYWGGFVIVGDAS